MIAGTRDLVGLDLLIRQKMIAILKDIFKNMDAIELDTPVIELKSTVMQMYGEEFNKLVYDLVDHKEEESPTKQILRYDLTVPLARFCAMNGIKALRRYQIGKVYRRDKPNIQNGRYREFYQCDFDIIGDDGGSGVNDIEILDLLVRVLDSLVGRGTYKIRINSRKLLVDILTNLGVDPAQVNSICSTLDKLDKWSWLDICDELQLRGMKADSMLIFRELAGSPNIDALVKYSDEATIGSIKNLFAMLESIGISDAFQFDLSLARGMDYYTGIIFEAVYSDKTIMPSTIAAGGRYDKMIGKLGTQGDVPAIGLSVGLERIVRIIQATDPNFCAETKPEIFVASIGTSARVLAERIKLCSDLRNIGLNVAMSNKRNPKMAGQFEVVFNRNIKYMVIIGENEINAGQIKIKEIATKVETAYSRSEGIDFLVRDC